MLLLFQGFILIEKFDNLFHILFQLSKSMQTVSLNKQPLSSLFADQNYAWQLLQSQIAVELSAVADGSDVARLLALYMSGVQRMNSLNDWREAYFKNKMTSLMGKQSVIKGFNNNLKTQTKRKCSIQSQQENIQRSENTEIFNSPKKIPQISPQLSYSLLQKKRQISVRLAYCAQQQSPENIQKILEQHKSKQLNLQKKITNIISDHQLILQERIRKRGAKSKIGANLSKMQLSFETEDLDNKLMDNQSIQDFILSCEQQNTESNSMTSEQENNRRIKLNDTSKQKSIVHSASIV